MSNNAAERWLRGVALGRKSCLFCGSDRGGRRAAATYSLIVTAKMNGIDPQAWLADVLSRIAGHPEHRLDELLPWSAAVASGHCGARGLTHVRQRGLPRQDNHRPRRQRPGRGRHLLFDVGPEMEPEDGLLGPEPRRRKRHHFRRLGIVKWLEIGHG
jgi:IS66 C-terminal element/Transposase IS66 family